MLAASNEPKLSSLQQSLLKRWQKASEKQGLTQEIKDNLMRCFDGDIHFDEPLSSHTWMKVGGPADAFLKPHSKQALIWLVSLAHEHDIPVTFLGHGANTLVKDGGIRGFVVSPYDTLKEFEIENQTEDTIDVRAEAGVSFQKLVHRSKQWGFQDLAALAGIPGTVGGLTKMNAGARGQEMQNLVRSIAVIHKDGEEQELGREKLNFEYRKLKIPKNQFISSVLLRLSQKADEAEVEAQIAEYQKKRSETQPLDKPCLGSIFKNPLPQTKNQVVVSAGQLIEEAGLKNVRVGGARVSPKHANFIVNEGGAQAKDVLSLVRLVRDKVKQMTGLVLETEIQILGEDAS